MSEPWTHHRTQINGFSMHYVTAGSGPPLVLLHGWPQSWYEWRKVIPSLAERFTVIAPDLRGLGDSERPQSGYDKRTIAGDVHELLRALGIGKAGVIGHDWGATVAFYLAHDWPDSVDRLMILDGVPGMGRIGDTIDLRATPKMGHFFFRAGMPDLVEKLVSRDVEFYLTYILTDPAYNYNPAFLSREEIAEYVRAYSMPGALRAGFQYYRAALSDDIENLSKCTGKIAAPVLAWGAQCSLLTDIVPIWKKVAEDVDGGDIAHCGHFIPEELPDVVIDESLKFFGASQS